MVEGFVVRTLAPTLPVFPQWKLQYLSLQMNYATASFSDLKLEARLCYSHSEFTCGPEELNHLLYSSSRDSHWVNHYTWDYIVNPRRIELKTYRYLHIQLIISGLLVCINTVVCSFWSKTYWVYCRREKVLIRKKWAATGLFCCLMWVTTATHSELFWHIMEWLICVHRQRAAKTDANRTERGLK